MILKRLSLFVLAFCFLQSCTENSENKGSGLTRDTTTPVIIIDKKIDTAYLNANYDNPKAAILHRGTCLDVKISGTVNTSSLGTYYLDYDFTDETGNMAATVTKTVHVVKNDLEFLHGKYDVVCTCTAVLAGSPTPTITITNYTASVLPYSANNRFELVQLKIGSDNVIPFPLILNGNLINVSFYHRDYVGANSTSSGTLSPTKNTFTIESMAYKLDPAIKYNCKNVYTKQQKAFE
jgi:hypothetical protein